MKSFLKNKFPLLYKNLTNIIYLFGYPRKVYSQFGEDVVLSTYVTDIDKIKKGFFVDIGAYHPKKYSNTYFFYKRGWEGINIDAKPGSMNIFNKLRKRDVNLEVAIAKEDKILDFYIFEEAAYNTFSEQMAKKLISQGITLDKKIRVETKKLSEVLDTYMIDRNSIDFMSIDVEGLDMDVLESNNWDKYKPKYILIEKHNVDIENIKESEIYKFLCNKNYRLVSVVYITLIFKYGEENINIT